MHDDLKRLTVLNLVGEGHAAGQACLMAGISRNTLDAWIRRDATFKQQYQEARARAGKAKRKQKANGDTQPEPTSSLLPLDIRERTLDNIRKGGTLLVAATAAGMSISDFNVFMKVGMEDLENKQDSEMAQFYRDVVRCAGEARLQAESSLLQDQAGFWILHSPQGRETPEVPGWHRSEYRRIDATNKFSGKIVAEWATNQHPQIVEAGTLALPGPQANPFSLTEAELLEIDDEIAALDN
jgi:hypothetical protein